MKEMKQDGKTSGAGHVRPASSFKLPETTDSRGFKKGSKTDSKGTKNDGFEKIKSYGSVLDLPEHVPHGRG